MDSNNNGPRLSLPLRLASESQPHASDKPKDMPRIPLKLNMKDVNRPSEIDSKPMAPPVVEPLALPKL
jgi:hypothetical protein